VALTVEEVPYDAPEAVALREAQELEALERFGAEPDVAEAARVDVLLVVRDGSGRAVACGGLRGLADGACELAGVFVRPYARGAGVGRMLLGELERRASARGFAVVRAETEPIHPEAAALLDRAGYRRVESTRPGATRFERRI
jgi:putative acetyltransferase